MSIVSDLAELQRIAGNTVGLMYQCYGCGKLMTPDEFASLGGSRHCTPVKLVKRVSDVALEDREDYKAGVAAERERCSKIADGMGLAARRLRSGYGHMHPGINNYAQCFDHESDRIREGK